MQPDSPSDTTNRFTIPRAICLVLAVMALPSAVRDLYGLTRAGFDPLLAIFGVCTALFVAMCVWFALRGHRAASRARMKLVMLGGFAVGAIGFAIGFFGPLVWSPGANQGPLLGIFITGPAGFVIGAAIGWLYARARIRPTQTPSLS